jgi:pyruvate kinase
MKIKVNKTKIVATFGPACQQEKTLLSMIAEGVDVFRFNFSHGTHDQHLAGVNIIRKVNEKHGLNIGILADLQGPKIRLGIVANEFEMLKTGTMVTLTSQKGISTAERLCISYDLLEKDVKPGEVILIDDGKVKVQVIRSNGKDAVLAKVIHGGKISSNKGVNFPQTKTTVPSLTPKDKKDLQFALETGFNWIALSFVRKAEDITALKKMVGKRNSYIKVMAKIEKPEALTELDEIIRASDGIMIARGDLAVEVAQERMPLIQKDIIRRCLRFAKPVVVATQMMESMIENPNPTRAEITDVANAVIDGADAVMLSGETSTGKHPVKVIETMESIIRNVEKGGFIYDKETKADKNSSTFVSDAICYNAARISGEVNARAITAMTFSGYTAFMLSSYRPRAKIFIFTENKELLNSLSICWGVYSFRYSKFVGTDTTIREIIGMMKKKKYLSPGDFVINVASMPLANRGRANMLKVTVVE